VPIASCRLNQGVRTADKQKEPKRWERSGPKATINHEAKAMAAKKAKGVNDATVQRLNVRVSTEAYERLLVHAIKGRISPGELITSLIDRHLKDWRVQDVRSKETDRPSVAGPVRESESAAA
jgi:hypothetical protein